MDASGGDIFAKMKGGRWSMVFLGVVLAVAGLLGYVRFAPGDVGRWHVAPDVRADRDFSGGVVRRVETGADGLTRLDTVARATPRTSVLAGSVAGQMVTYVTRSAVFGFPDYTTVQQVGDRLAIYARLRFGRSDMGVNKARVGRWIKAIQAR